VILDRLPLWIHVREGRFALAAITAVIVFFVLLGTDNAGATTAFFAGYTVDSFSDVAFQRFNAAVSQQSAAVKKLLS
jgi:hypothetical protein